MKKVGCICFQCIELEGFVVVGCYDDDWNIDFVGVVFDVFGEFCIIYKRYLEIGYNQVGGVVCKLFESFYW